VLTATVVGVGSAVQRLKDIKGKVRAELMEEVKKQTYALLRRTKELVSGPVLMNRTGTLRRKLNATLDVDTGRVVGTVGIKLSYAAAHEFGSNASGTSQVKEHTRRNVRQMLQDTKIKYSKKTMTATLRDTKKQLGRGVITVHAHTRKYHMNLPERSFLRRALDERRDEIEAGIRAAVERGTKA